MERLIRFRQQRKIIKFMVVADPGSVIMTHKQYSCSCFTQGRMKSTKIRQGGITKPCSVASKIGIETRNAAGLGLRPWAAEERNLLNFHGFPPLPPSMVVIIAFFNFVSKREEGANCRIRLTTLSVRRPFRLGNFEAARRLALGERERISAMQEEWL